MKKLSRAAMATLTLASSVTVVAGGVAGAGAATANGGTLTIGQGLAYNDEFIPFMAGSLYTGNIDGFAFDSLMTVNNHLGYIPWLAKKWAWSKDKKTLTMWLQPHANWSDGKPITSDDVLYFMDYLASPTYNNDLQGQYEFEVDPVLGSDLVMKGTAASFADTGGFKKVNDKEFQVTFKTVDAAVLWSDVSNWTPIPKHVLEKIPMKDWPTSTFDKQPNVVSGPYVFSQVNGEDNVVMTANPHYWAGAPHISQVVWKTVEANVAPGLLANGQVDIQLNGLKPTDVSKLKQLPSIGITASPQMGYGYLGLKEYHPEFKDVRVRQAFEYVINRQQMIKGILAGYGQPINSPVPSLSWAAATTKQGLNPYNYNPAKAKQLLDAAGWKVNSKGWRVDPITGQQADLHLDYSAGSPTVEAEAVAIQQYLAKVGVKVTLNTPLDFNALVTKVENDDKNLQMWLMAWSLGVDPDPRGLWDSTDSYNFERWVSAKEDKLVGATWNAAAFNQSVRKQAFIKWELYVNQQMPLNFMWQQDNIFAVNNRVNIPANDWIPGYGPGFVQQWTLK